MQACRAGPSGTPGPTLGSAAPCWALMSKLGIRIHQDSQSAWHWPDPALGLHFRLHRSSRGPLSPPIYRERDRGPGSMWGRAGSVQTGLWTWDWTVFLGLRSHVVGCRWPAAGTLRLRSLCCRHGVGLMGGLCHPLLHFSCSRLSQWLTGPDAVLPGSGL